MSSVAATAASAQAALPAPADPRQSSDGAILNFALNLEYLEAEFYLHAYYGTGLTAQPDHRQGRPGRRHRRAQGATSRPRRSSSYAREIARDELEHVEFLREALGAAKVARPAIDLKSSFTAAARAAGLISSKQTFDPFANENNFLLAAFIFEDVGVTAYKGAAPLIDNKTYLEAAAGILAVEAYHAGIVRTALYDKGLLRRRRGRSRRARQPGRQERRRPGHRHARKHGNLVPTDGNGIAYSRSPATC